MKLPFHHRTTCCLCGSEYLEDVCEITKLPFKSPNVGRDSSNVGSQQNADLLVPLNLHMCGACYHLQLADIVDPEIQYTNYNYRTSISVGLAKHFGSSFDQVASFVGRELTGLNVLEVGSNDGTYLKYFLDAGCNVLGVEPAQNISSRARDAGIPTLTDFFNSTTASDLLSSHGAFDVILANYVLANIEDVSDVVEGIRHVLAKEGVFVFETQYGVDVLENFLVDTIYHEHISYFNVLPLKSFFENRDLKIVDVQKIPTKGGSIRVYVQHSNAKTNSSPAVEDLVRREERAGFGSGSSLRSFSRQIRSNKDDISRVLSGQNLIAGFGASVGTMTLLHLYELTDRVIYICDDKPMQDSLHGPYYEIPIVSGHHLEQEPVDAVFLFAWRYSKNIIPKHHTYLANGGQFIVPLPKVQVFRDVELTHTDHAPDAKRE